MYPDSPATSRHWLRSYHGVKSHLRLELSSRFGVRWTKALPSSFSTADLAETWCRTSARCFHPPPAGGARAAFLTGHEGVFHPHVRFWSAVGFHYSLSRFPSFDHSRRLFTSLTSLLSVAPSRFPRVCISFSLSTPFRSCSSGICSPFSVRVLLCSLFESLSWFFSESSLTPPPPFGVSKRRQESKVPSKGREPLPIPPLTPPR